MKKINSIREFIDYAPRCLFCEHEMKIVMSHQPHKSKKGSLSISSNKAVGTALYRDVIEKSALNTTYNYSCRVENDWMFIRCSEDYYLAKHPSQQYDVIKINIDSSDIELESKVEVGILNSFARINFRLISKCNNPQCMGHRYASTGIIAGAKTKKLMPFFLREECMAYSMGTGDDSILYTLISDYYSQDSVLEKSSGASDYNIPWAAAPSLGRTVDPQVHLPLIDLSLVKTKETFEIKVENYVTFS